MQRWPQGIRPLVAAALAFNIQGTVFVAQGRHEGVLAVLRGAIAFGKAKGAGRYESEARPYVPCPPTAPPTQPHETTGGAGRRPENLKPSGLLRGIIV